jgi:GH24 family phage-related lysozyme (muramidase)
MRSSVLSAFPAFTKKFEGYLPYMYLDILGYVTTGAGNLVDPVSLALALPWQNADGSASSQADIEAAWNAVDAERSDPKGQTQTSGLATKYGQAFGGVTSIRLTDDAIDALVQSQMATNEQTIVSHVPGWEDLYADAQLGVMSMAWAMGAGFLGSFPAFTQALNKSPPDYAAAKANAGFRGSGVATRIAANAIAFQNAHDAQAAGADPETLYYPGTYSGLSTLAKVGLVALPLAAALGAWQWERLAPLARAAKRWIA